MKDFKKYFILTAPPEEVYWALTKALSIQLWTGEKAIMEEVEGSDFSIFDGNIVGKNLAFEYGKKIVQQWYFDGQEQDSIVTIKLHEHKRGTSMEVLHTNIPDESFEEFETGWNDYYGAALIDYFEVE